MSEKEVVQPKLFYGSDSEMFHLSKSQISAFGYPTFILSTPLIRDEDQKKQHVRICVEAEGETGNMRGTPSLHNHEDRGWLLHPLSSLALAIDCLSRAAAPQPRVSIPARFPWNAATVESAGKLGYDVLCPFLIPVQLDEHDGDLCYTNGFKKTDDGKPNSKKWIHSSLSGYITGSGLIPIIPIVFALAERERGMGLYAHSLQRAAPSSGLMAIDTPVSEDVLKPV
ncbi:hypothetical protein H4582DRAFT_2052181 [Lactarius indigo]|nr:hypothetical protein H4582DRAFT_2052181 [Lactarius indigo]